MHALQPCREVALLMSESLDRRLGVLEHLQVKLHLMLCAWCARYFRQIKFLRQLVHRRPLAAATTSPVALSAEARQRIGRSLLKNPESCSETHAADGPKDQIL